MSGSSHTPSRTAHLTLVTGAGDGSRTGELAVIPPSQRLTGFVEAAAQRGLDADEAVQLGFERALVLADAGLFRLGLGSARYVLNAAAAAARPGRPLGPRSAARLRSLTAACAPVSVADTADGLSVRLSERLLTRARDAVNVSCLTASVVPEMVSWEVAALLEGSSLAEWALRVFALRRAEVA